MKRFLAIILSLTLLVVLPLGAGAADISSYKSGEKVVFTDGTWAYEKLSGYGYEIDEYIGTSASADVPYSFAKQYITAIGDYAFNGNSTISVVNTTSVLERLGDYAFNNCQSLSKITLYSSLTDLGIGCFYGDGNLTDINLEDTSINSVPAYCFAESGVTGIKLPETCESIGNYAFYNCSSLTEIFIPKSVTEINPNAFTGINGLTIKGNRNSYAQTFANANGINFETVPLYGDADENDTVDILDTTFIQRFRAGLVNFKTEYGRQCADVNKDGKVTLRDATMIQMKIAGMDAGF